MADGRISDPKALRALSHPFRWKLIQLLTEEGPATATRCSEKLGESVASCSYHLNMLAKYGFVEEVSGPGRQKPWRLVSQEQNFSPDGLEPEAAMAAEAAADAFLEQEFSSIRTRLRGRDREPEEWRELFGLTGATNFLTADELAEVKAELRAVIERFAERREDPAARPADARAVRFFLSITM